MLANSTGRLCTSNMKLLAPRVPTLPISTRNPVFVPAPLAAAAPHARRGRSSLSTCRALGAPYPGPQGGSSEDEVKSTLNCLEDYLEVKVDSVRVTSGSSVVFLRLLSMNKVIPLHAGDSESAALLKEINGQKGQRPVTHDLAKHIMSVLGGRVTKIMITEMVNNIFYTSIHIVRNGSSEEWQLDARPSDAINLAVRFEAPMYINRHLVDSSRSLGSGSISVTGETYMEIIRTVRETLTSFQDPTTVLRLQQDLAVRDERYHDAHRIQLQINELIVTSVQLRLMVSMEAAVADGRFDEAAKLRDEYRQLLANQQERQQQPATVNGLGLGY